MFRNFDNAKNGIRIIPFILIVMLLLVFCQKSNKQTLATFNNGQITVQDYLDHYLLSTQYKPDQMPTRENLTEVVKEKAFEKIAVFEALEGKIDTAANIQKLLNVNEQKILYKIFVRKVIVDSIVTDSLIQKYYNEFSPQYRMRYIIRPVLTASTLELEQAQKDSIQYIYQLLKKGKDFQEAAKKYSQDVTTSAKGGDLGWVIRESLGDGVLRAVMDTLKMGAFSEPVRGYEGYYIILKEDKREVARPPFNEAAPRIRQGLEHSRQHLVNNKVQELFEKLSDLYKFHVDDKEFDALIKKASGKPGHPFSMIDLSKLQEKDLLQKIAVFSGGSITLFDILREGKQTPETVKDLRKLLDQYSRRTLIANYAKTSELSRHPVVMEQIQQLNDHLLRSKYYNDTVSSVVKTKIDSIKNVTDIDPGNKAVFLRKESLRIEKGNKKSGS